MASMNFPSPHRCFTFPLFQSRSCISLFTDTLRLSPFLLTLTTYVALTFAHTYVTVAYVLLTLTYLRCDILVYSGILVFLRFRFLKKVRPHFFRHSNFPRDSWSCISLFHWHLRWGYLPLSLTLTWSYVCSHLRYGGLRLLTLTYLFWSFLRFHS